MQPRVLLSALIGVGLKAGGSGHDEGGGPSLFAVVSIARTGQESGATASWVVSVIFARSHSELKATQPTNNPLFE